MPEHARRRARPSRQRSPAGSPALYGAVDLGTNNCRMLIAEPRHGTFRPIDSHSQIVRLGEGLARDGRISDAALERGILALTTIREKLKARGVRNVRCVATQACRAAENGREFIERVQAEVGLSFKVITPKEEARLAVIGCHNLYDEESDTALVVDIGGGSTELSWVDLREASAKGLNGMLARVPLIDWATFPVGVVTLTEAFQDLPEPERFDAMYGHACALMSGFERGAALRRRMERGPSHLVGTSGTVTSLAAVNMGLDRYIRTRVDGSWMNRAEASGTSLRLREIGPDGRRTLPCIGPDRADLIMAGCAILEAVFAHWPADRLRVADRGLREGLLLSMMYGPKTSRRRRRGRKTLPGVESAARPIEGCNND